MRFSIVTLLLVSICTVEAFGQNSFYHSQSKTIYPPFDSVLLDSFSIVPGTVKIMAGSDSLPHQTYKVNWVEAEIYFKTKPTTDSITISYNRFDYKLNKKKYLREYAIINDEMQIKYNEMLDRNHTLVSIYKNEDQLEKTGSISRGVAFGNNQNLSVNSNLDLQLTGNLSEDYNLVATLSDRNIPIQPDGTTSNLQEFDQVFVKLSGKGSNVILGDFFVSSKDDDYFLKTYKKSQGVSAFQDIALGNNKVFTAGTNIGVARGKFARNTFNGQEGNQGPYRLTGENGELFIIVIAGTERVFVNGQQLERGEQNQYTIDYNSGEVVFTPNQLITSLDRIVVEFQYADNSYERTLTHVMLQEKGNDFTWRVNYYKEQDNKNKPFYTTFNREDIIDMARAGDDISKAYKLSEDTSNITANTIRYRKTDTIVDGVVYPGVYVQTNNKVSGIYKVTFTLVGQGKGNYTQEPSLVNGRVYKWQSPKNGEPRGSYEPIIKLIAPKKNELITAQLDKSFGNKLSIRSDLAYSVHDLNTFSNLDAADNTGLGSRLILDYKDSVFSKKAFFEAETRAEYTSLNFTGIERFRSVEFSRTWNRQLSNQTNILGSQTAVLVGGAGVSLSNKKYKISHNSNFLSLTNQLAGSQQQTEAGLQLGKKKLNISNNITQTQTLNDTLGGVVGNFSVQHFDMQIPLLKLTLGAAYDRDVNTFRYANRDSLFMQSFGYTQYGLSLGTSDTSKITMKLGINRRTNLLPDSGILLTQSRSTDLISKFGFGSGKNYRVDLNTTYRIFDNTTTDGDSLDNNTLLNRIEYRLKLLKSSFQTNSYYQIGTGRERQYEIMYINVGKGQGDYVWSDINNNGKQDLGEFRPQEYTGQGSYTRTVVNSNQYVNAISNEFYQSINLLPAVVWTGKKGIRGFIARWSNQTNGSINRKTTDNNSAAQYNPFSLNIDADYLISSNAQIRNSLYFNRLSQKLSAEYTFLNLSTKNLFIFGFESQAKKEHLVQIRWNLSNILTMYPSATIGNLNNRSEAFEQKNYTLAYADYKLKGQVQRDNSLRTALNVEQYKATNPANAQEAVVRNLVGAELTYSKALKGIITLKIDYVKVHFNGEKNSPIGFAMLNGLQPGTNYTWSVISNYQISKQAQIGINYEGRYSEINKVIQTGSVNARWLF
ncbi:hypothetical protein GC194_08505 [bacterium]|nr:hypothetical protein [bacterium]